jgi:hypothetical protein
MASGYSMARGIGIWLFQNYGSWTSILNYLQIPQEFYRDMDFHLLLESRIPAQHKF